MPEIAKACALVRNRAGVLVHNPAAPPNKDELRWGPLVDLAARDQGVAESAESFLQLQEQRQEADYDHLARFDKGTLLGAWQTAEETRARLSGADPAALQALLALLAVGRPDLRAR